MALFLVILILCGTCSANFLVTHRYENSAACEAHAMVESTVKVVDCKVSSRECVSGVDSLKRAIISMEVYCVNSIDEIGGDFLIYTLHHTEDCSDAPSSTELRPMNVCDSVKRIWSCRGNEGSIDSYKESAEGGCHSSDEHPIETLTLGECVPREKGNYILMTCTNK